MLITALATIVAANLAWDNALDVRRTMVMLNRDQAVQVALGAESLVQNVLRQDLQDSQTDHLAEFWSGDLPVFPIDGGEVFGTIEDLQGRFNINNLIATDGTINDESLEQFRRLLNALALEPRFAGIAADWLDRLAQGDALRHITLCDPSRGRVMEQKEQYRKSNDDYRQRNAQLGAAPAKFRKQHGGE